MLCSYHRKADTAALTVPGLCYFEFELNQSTNSMRISEISGAGSMGSCGKACASVTSLPWRAGVVWELCHQFQGSREMPGPVSHEWHLWFHSGGVKSQLSWTDTSLCGLGGQFRDQHCLYRDFLLIAKYALYQISCHFSIKLCHIPASFSVPAIISFIFSIRLI